MKTRKGERRKDFRPALKRDKVRRNKKSFVIWDLIACLVCSALIFYYFVSFCEAESRMRIESYDTHVSSDLSDLEELSIRGY